MSAAPNSPNDPAVSALAEVLRGCDPAFYSLAA
jgi:hypothetical protein